MALPVQQVGARHPHVCEADGTVVNAIETHLHACKGKERMISQGKSESAFDGQTSMTSTCMLISKGIGTDKDVTPT